MTHFVKYILKEMNHDKQRDKIVFDSLVKGTGVHHLYYNQNKFGTYGDFVGGLCEEVLDFKNVSVANPFNKDLQAQKWIIIKQSKPVGAIKELVKDKAKIAKILSDEFEQDTVETPIQDSDTVNVYLRYYRKNGEVYHSLSTQTVQIYKDKPLNPNLVNVKKEITDKEDNEWIMMPDDTLEKNSPSKYEEVKFYRYPLDFLTLNDSDESIYGYSELKGVISTQKYINQLWSMQLLNVQNTAWDKYVVLPNALRGQIINDKSGQVITDYSGTGNGIRRLGGMNAMANGVVDLAANAFNLHKNIYQITDLYTGQTDAKDITASALSQLNSQADKPIDVLRKKLWAFEEEMGKTIELFVRLFYSQQEFEYEMTESEKIRNGIEGNVYQQETFDPNSLKNVKFHISAEAIQGTKDSELIQENLVQTLFLNGTWGKMSYHDKEMYIAMSPLVESIKDKMTALLKVQEQDTISQLEGANQQLMQQNQSLVNTLKRAQNATQYLGNMNKSLQKSYKDEYELRQQENQARDEAVQEVLTKQPNGKMLEKQN